MVRVRVRIRVRVRVRVRVSVRVSVMYQECAGGDCGLSIEGFEGCAEVGEDLVVDLYITEKE